MTAAILQLLLLPALRSIDWSADIWTAASLMYPSYVIVGMISGGLLFSPLLFARRPAVMVVPSLWLEFLVALPFMANNSLKPLLRGGPGT